MTAAGMTQTGRYRLSRLWRKRLTEPAAATPAPAAPEETTVGHTYASDAYQPDPGQSTTALGRHVARDLIAAAAPDRSLEQETRVIRRHPLGQPSHMDLTVEPLLFNALAAEHGWAPWPDLEADAPGVPDEPEVVSGSDSDHSGDVIAWATGEQPQIKEGGDVR